MVLRASLEGEAKEVLMIEWILVVVLYELMLIVRDLGEVWES